MPKTTTHGNAGPANSAIGGIPTIHYFDFKSRGRGQVLRLLLIDAGAAYKDIRYSFEEWPNHKEGLLKDLNPTGNIPVVVMEDGKVLTQSYAILRHWARLLGKYDGRDEGERYWVDRICDIVVDWRTLFISAFFSPNVKEDYPVHQKGNQQKYLKAIETHLKNSEFSKRGPFIIGTEITYADMVLYQILHDENLVQEGRKGLEGFPRLKELVDAVEGRENIKKFLGSGEYLG